MPITSETSLQKKKIQCKIVLRQMGDRLAVSGLVTIGLGCLLPRWALGRKLGHNVG